MKRSGVIWSWFWMVLGILYFFLPLVGHVPFLPACEAWGFEFSGLSAAFQ